MGYIKKVVQTGAEFADRYQMPDYVAKARGSSKIIDVASEKIEKIYCEKGSPLLTTLDELTAAKINTALAVANNKVEQAQKLKTVAADKVHEKTTEAIEIAKQTKASACEKTFMAKQEGIAKYHKLKIEASKKVDETKTIMRNRYILASEEACRLEEIVEKKLKEKASTNAYANKVLSVVMTAKEQVKIYGEALVKKSFSLPLTLQERMEKGLSFAKEQVEVGNAVFQAKRAKMTSFVVTSYKDVSTKMSSDNAFYAVNTVFGEKAALKAKDMLQDLKKANVSQKVADKMKHIYTYSTYQVGHFAGIAEKMEEKYVGTSLVFKARARFSAK